MFPLSNFVPTILFPVDKNGDVCISILHEPGEDKYGYEKPEERWLPIHTVETIMISVISMLADPNGDSPANVDAAVSPLRPLAYKYLKWQGWVCLWERSLNFYGNVILCSDCLTEQHVLNVMEFSSLPLRTFFFIGFYYNLSL